MAGDIEPIHSAKAAPPGGHYSQAVVHGGVAYISGQLPVQADGGHSADRPFSVQAGIALGNLAAILEAAGCRLEDLLSVTVYLVGIEHWPAFDRLYAGFLGAHRPARAIVPVPALHHGYLIEIQAQARCVERKA